MELIQNNRSFEGEQRIYRFDSHYLKTSTKFGIYLPPQALEGHSCPALFYLAGLTCTEETFAIKAHAQRLASQLGLILITPDTSPRGEGVAEGDNWDIGQGAGFISMQPRSRGLNITRWKASLWMSSMHWSLRNS